MSAEDNPYSAPASDINTDFEEETKIARPIAGKGVRFGTLLIDYLCFMAMAFGLGIVLMLVFGEEGMERLNDIPDRLVGAVILIAYYCVFEGIWAHAR